MPTSRRVSVASPPVPSLWSRRRFLGAGAALSAGAALGACSLNRGSTPDNSAEADEGAGFAGEVLDPPWAKPDVTFTALDGQPFPFVERTEGALSLLFFGYTNCPDICPVYLQTVASAREAIGTGPGSKPDVYFVGVDVARDTPEVMETYLANIDPTFVGLTGSIEAINAGLEAVYSPPVQLGEPDADGAYEVGHAAYGTVYLGSDDKGHRRYPFGVRQQDWVRDLPRLEEGRFR